MLMSNQTPNSKKKSNKSATTSQVISLTFKMVFSVLLCVSVIVVSLSAALKFIVMNKDYYTQKIVNEQYVSDSKTYILENVEYVCIFYGLPYDVIKGVVTDDEIARLSKMHAGYLYDSMETGDTLTFVSYPSDKFSNVIKQYVDEIKDEEQKLSDEEIELVSDDLAASVSSDLNAFYQEKLIKLATTYIFNHNIFNTISEYFYLLMIICAVLVLAGFVLLNDTFVRRLYLISGAMWCGITVPFVTITIIKIYNFPEKLVIGDSTLKFFIDRFWRTAIDASFSVLLIVFLILSGLILLSTTLQLLQRYNRSKEKHILSETDNGNFIIR